MKIIISPAKKMNTDSDTFHCCSLPLYIEKSNQLKKILSQMTYEQLKKLWSCNDNIASLNFERLKIMDLENASTPAIFSYDGIQYKHIAPNVFTYDELEYIQEHVVILSGFYGMLRPFDSVVPYRLEMQASLKTDSFSSLYDFWGDLIAKHISSETETIINLASKEYSKIVSDHLPENIQFITCSFGELKDEKLIEKGTLCKMARGEMVRFMAENSIENVEKIKDFNRLNYKFSPEKSTKSNYIFITRRD